MFDFKIFSLLLVLLCHLGLCISYECVEYIPGNANLIISAPHGGYHEISKCPVRREGCLDQQGNCYYDSSSDCSGDPKCPFVSVLDTDTQEIGRMVADNIDNLLGKRPHLVIMKCSRKSVDVNREIKEAAQSCPDAETAHDTYHNTIRSIIDNFEGERGLLLDLHGQSHKQNRTEFGYAISKENIDAAVAHPDNEFSAEALAECSITALLARLTSSGGISNWDVIGGIASIGHLLENEGFGALPGPVFPKPGETSYKYFDGGYTVRTHGSHSPSDNVDAIQMETPAEVRFQGGPEMQRAFALGLARTIVAFFNANY